MPVANPQVNFGNNFFFVTQAFGQCFWWTARCTLPDFEPPGVAPQCTLQPCCRAKVLSVLEWLDGALTREGFEYVLEGGSLLGALRHGGFIPWDHDADIIVFVASLEEERRLDRFLSKPRTGPFDKVPVGDIYPATTSAEDFWDGREAPRRLENGDMQPGDWIVYYTSVLARHLAARTTPRQALLRNRPDGTAPVVGVPSLIGTALCTGTRIETTATCGSTEYVSLPVTQALSSCPLGHRRPFGSTTGRWIRACLSTATFSLGFDVRLKDLKLGVRPSRSHVCESAGLM